MWAAPSPGLGPWMEQKAESQLSASSLLPDRGHSVTSCLTLLLSRFADVMDVPLEV